MIGASYGPPEPSVSAETESEAEADPATVGAKLIIMEQVPPGGTEVELEQVLLWTMN